MPCALKFQDKLPPQVGAECPTLDPIESERLDPAPCYLVTSELHWTVALHSTRYTGNSLLFVIILINTYNSSGADPVSTVIYHLYDRAAVAEGDAGEPIKGRWWLLVKPALPDSRCQPFMKGTPGSHSARAPCDKVLRE